MTQSNSPKKVAIKRIYKCVVDFFIVSTYCFGAYALANPITDENLNPGSRGWVLSNSASGKASTDPVGQIKGFMTSPSVNKGGQISFKVSVSPAQNFSIQIYRVGWYGGNGGRLMQTIGPIAGTTQPACPRDETTGMVECNWATSYTLTVPTTWTSGIYLAKLINANGFDSGTLFTVRDDSRVADFLYKQPVYNYQAYNQWPEGVNGKSFYGNVLGEPKAVKVSFNRPYAGYRSSSNGYADFPQWELQLVKWLEKEGYDVAYSTDADFQTNVLNLLNYHGLISPGHDEYWSKEIRDGFEYARSNGVGLAFFGSNAAYWQSRLEPATTDGAPNRTLVCYKSSALDPMPTVALKTDLFKSASINRPEQSLLGVMYITYSNIWAPGSHTPLIIKNSSSWVYQGSGLTEGQSIPNLVGYEIDYVNASFALPPNTEFTKLAESPFVNTAGATFLQNSVIYKTPQSSWVFAAGTMAWSWALDYDATYSYLGDRRSPPLQKVTRNILDRIAGFNHAPTGQPEITGIIQEDQVLTANTSNISDEDGLGAFNYQWKRNGANISGATSSSYTLGNADVGSQITLVVSYTDGWGKVETISSAASVAVVNVNDLPTGSVTISGTPNINQTLTASNNLADADGLGAITYQWLRNGVNIAGATASTYALTSADVGTQITVAASYTDGHGTAEKVTSAPVSVSTNNRPPVGLPVISGTAQENQILTVSTSGISDPDGLGAFSYQWQRNGVNIAGATTNAYTLVDADVGSLMTVVISYTDGLGKLETVTSAATSAVINVNDLPTGNVVISGSANVGSILTASNTIADADGLGAITYQWLRNGVNIPGATASTYVLTLSDSGAQITVAAGYTDGHGTVERVISAVFSVVIGNSPPAGLPVITGTAQENQILGVSTAGISDPDGIGAFSYQWQRNGVNVAGATTSAYTLTDIDVNKSMSVVVSYTDGLGKLETVTSAATSAVVNVNDLPTGSVSISGLPNVGATLTASNTIADADGLGTITYQWRRNGVNISGATGSTYIVTANDTGAQISVAASYVDGFGTAERVISSNLNAPSYLGTKRLRNVQYSTCAYVSSTSEGSTVKDTTCSSTSTSHKWNIVQVDATTFRLANQFSNKVMAASSTSSGTTVTQQTLSTNARTQLWRIQASTNGSYNLVNQNSGLCLSTDSFSFNVLQRTCSTSSLQKWNIIN